MNILFIGGTGNISSACTACLHEQGHRITVVTRGTKPVPASYTAVAADRHDETAMKTALTGMDIDVAIDFTGFVPEDVEQDYRLFNGRVRQFIFISSATVYSKPPKKLPITESMPVGNPFLRYAQNKEACESFLMRQYNDNGFPVTIVRPSHTYSPQWIPNQVSSGDYTLAARLEQNKPVFVVGDGQNLWTLTAASDFATGFAGLIGKDEAIGETFHITSDQALTWNQIYTEIAWACGVRKPNIVPVPMDFLEEHFPEFATKMKGDKAQHAVFDNAKIKRAVPEFECQKSTRQGLREAVNWYRTDPARKTVHPDTDKVFNDILAAFEKS